jgi:hypothetical protein
VEQSSCAARVAPGGFHAAGRAMAKRRGKTTTVTVLNLRAERLDRGLNLKQAGILTGVNWWVLRDAEQGRIPQPANRRRIAEFYGVKPSDIWPIAEQNGQPARTQPIKKTRKPRKAGKSKKVDSSLRAVA